MGRSNRSFGRAILVTVAVVVLLSAGVMSAFASDGTFSTKWGSLGSATGQFNRPHDVAVGPSGDIYVIDTLNNRVQRFTSSGGFVSSFGSGGGTPYGLHVDSAGSVFVADSASATNAVRKYSSTGTLQLTLSGITGARDVDTDSAGNIYVTSQTGYVRRYNSSGSSFVTLVTGLAGPRCLAVAPSGDIYVTEYSANRVSQYTSAGAFVRQWGGAGSGDGQFLGDVGIAVGPDGDVYTTEIGNNRIQRFTATGVFVTKWGTAGSGDGQFNGVRGIALDSAGDAYTADTDNHRIQKFGTTPPPPVVSTPASSMWSLVLTALLALVAGSVATRRLQR